MHPQRVHATWHNTARALVARRARVLLAQLILATGPAIGAIVRDHLPMTLTVQTAADVAPSTMPSYVPSPMPHPPSGSFHPGPIWPYAVMAAVTVYLVAALLIGAWTGRLVWPLNWIAARSLRGVGLPSNPVACPDCGEPLEASDDTITSHACPEAER